MQVITSFGTPYNNPSGLAWDGKYLWLSDDTNADYCNKNGIILKIDPNSGIVVKKFESPGCDPDGLTWDGKYLWVTDKKDSSRKIFKIDSSDGNITESIASPGGNPYGLAWDGRYLWITDLNTNKIYRMNINDESFFTLNSPADKQRDIAWDGKYLWVSDSHNHYGENGTIFKIEPSNDKVVEFFDSQGPNPDGLTWDGNFLWVADNKNQKIYKIDVTNYISSPTTSSTTSSTQISTSTQTIDYKVQDIEKSSETAPDINIESIKKLLDGTFQLNGIASHESGIKNVTINGNYVGKEYFIFNLTGEKNLVINANSNDGNTTLENINLLTETSLLNLTGEKNLVIDANNIDGNTTLENINSTSDTSKNQSNIFQLIGLLFGTGLVVKIYRIMKEKDII